MGVVLEKTAYHIYYAKNHLESKRLCRLNLDFGLWIKILDPPSLRNRVKCGVLGGGLGGRGNSLALDYLHTES